MDYSEEIDGYECRLQLEDLLKKISGSQQAVVRICDFCIKHSKHHHHDLYNCLKESISDLPSLHRVNIFYVFHDVVMKEKHGDGVYTRLLQDDICGILESVLPESDVVTFQNLTTIKKILGIWREKKLFPRKKLDLVEDIIKKREALRLQIANQPKPMIALTHEEIYKRMEEDRDRYKRSREESWCRSVNQNNSNVIVEPIEGWTVASHGKNMHILENTVNHFNDLQEFEEMWENLPDDLDDVDYEVMSLENDRFVLAKYLQSKM